MFFLRLGLLVVPMLVWQAGAQAATLRVFQDKAKFLGLTAATNATGKLPNLGLVDPAAGATVGTVTFSLAPGGDNLFVGAKGTSAAPDWYRPTRGRNDIALGLENLRVETVEPVYSLGFEMVEPDTTMPPYGGTPVDSTYRVTLFQGAEPVGEFEVSNLPKDVVTFVGVWSDTAFDRAEIVDVTEETAYPIDDDEYFGEFYSGALAAGANAIQRTPDDEYAAICALAPDSDALRAYLADERALSVKDFGAAGDGVTNDLLALRRAAKNLCKHSSPGRRSTLVYPNGTYLLEGYYPFGAPWPEWGVHFGIDRTDVDNPTGTACRNVRVLGCGSTIDVHLRNEDGEAHKNYEGDPNEQPLPQPEERLAHEYQLIPFFIVGSDTFELRGFRLDGNADEITFDPLIRAEGFDPGVLTETCSDFILDDIQSTNFPSDGFIVGTGAPADERFVIRGVTASENCRAGLALIQVRHFEVTDSYFTDGGACKAGIRQADGNITPFPGFSPALGVGVEPDCSLDPEAEGYCPLFGSKAGHGVFDNIHVYDNLGSGFSSAHSDRVEDITIRNSFIRNRAYDDTTDCSQLDSTPAGACAFSLVLADGVAEFNDIDSSKGFAIFWPGEPGDSIVFRDNVVRGANVLLRGDSNQTEVLVQDNIFIAENSEHTAEPTFEQVPLISLSDVKVDPLNFGPLCIDRRWRFVDNTVVVKKGVIPAGYPNSVVGLGGLAESTGNTFQSSHDEPLVMVYDYTERIADVLEPANGWAPQYLAGCVDPFDGLLEYEEGISACSDPAIPVCPPAP